MLPTTPWQAILALLSLTTPASSAGILYPRDVVNDWVSVDDSGKPHTHTADVTTENGAIRTVAGAPYMLTGSVFTVSSSTRLFTSTGSPPPPEARETDGAGGQFAVCHNRVGKDGPFCQPAAESELSLGRTYYVTWDTTFFGVDARDNMVNITANFLPSGRQIMNSVPVRADQGYMPLTIRESFMLGQEVQKPIRLIMAYVDDDGELQEIPGPRVNILRADISVVQADEDGSSGGRSGPHPAAIAVPVVAGLLAVGLGFWCLWRRGKDKFILSRIRRRSSQGYGVSKSRTARMGGGEDEIDLKVSPTSPTPRPGVNVFQEEIRRQDTGR